MGTESGLDDATWAAAFGLLPDGIATDTMEEIQPETLPPAETMKSVIQAQEEAMQEVPLGAPAAAAATGAARPTGAVTVSAAADSGQAGAARATRPMGAFEEEVLDGSDKVGTPAEASVQQGGAINGGEKKGLKAEAVFRPDDDVIIVDAASDEATVGAPNTAPGKNPVRAENTAPAPEPSPAAPFLGPTPPLVGDLEPVVASKKAVQAFSVAPNPSTENATAEPGAVPPVLLEIATERLKRVVKDCPVVIVHKLVMRNGVPSKARAFFGLYDVFKKGYKVGRPLMLSFDELKPPVKMAVKTLSKIEGPGALPQIWVGGVHCGSSANIRKLHKSKKLKKILHDFEDTRLAKTHRAARALLSVESSTTGSAPAN